jgi:hypothetical protein
MYIHQSSPSTTVVRACFASDSTSSRNRSGGSHQKRVRSSCRSGGSGSSPARVANMIWDCDPPRRVRVSSSRFIASMVRRWLHRCSSTPRAVLNRPRAL